MGKIFTSFVIVVLAIILMSYDNDGLFMKYHIDEIDINNYSSNPPPFRTGAPGETNCTDCHFGTVKPAEGSIEFSYSGNETYNPNQTYSITIGSILGGNNNGFELTILDSNNEKAGSFIPGPNSDKVFIYDKEYIFQTSSFGNTYWTFDWVAPHKT